LPLFQRALLAERFDIAIMSTKGVSVTAARRLVDELSGQGIQCLVLRDFDKAGFTIVSTLQKSGRRYVFRNQPQVIDLGLRLRDVQANRLDAEDVFYPKSDPIPNLHCNGATPEEIAVLCSGRSGTGYKGRRTELNAFASGALLQWIEEKLVAHGVKKMVPDQEVLLQAYRLAYEQRLMRRALRRLQAEAREAAKAIALPEDIVQQVQGQLEKHRDLPWDRAVEKLVARQLPKS
jgi:hypothetical protein